MGNPALMNSPSQNAFLAHLVTEGAKQVSAIGTQSDMLSNAAYLFLSLARFRNFEPRRRKRPDSNHSQRVSIVQHELILHHCECFLLN